MERCSKSSERVVQIGQDVGEENHGNVKLLFIEREKGRGVANQSKDCQHHRHFDARSMYVHCVKLFPYVDCLVLTGREIVYKRTDSATCISNWRSPA